MDSIFANNSGSTSGGAIYTHVRAMSQYKVFESIVGGCLFKDMLAFMQMQWNVAQENSLSYVTENHLIFVASSQIDAFAF